MRTEGGKKCSHEKISVLRKLHYARELPAYMESLALQESEVLSVRNQNTFDRTPDLNDEISLHIVTEIVTKSFHIPL